ncbi:MAG: hypothetical protein HOH31_02860 [Campylobacteraceae bacterium]|nr:hypothetical protein [Campylobacteraceae bacterium]
MKIQNTIYLLVCLFSLSLNANYFDEPETILDDTYDTTETFIYSTADYLDTSFSGEDYDIESQDLTKADISYESIFEKGQDSIQNSNIKIRLLFPRFRKQYKITFENYNKSKSIDETNENDSYLLGIGKDKARVGLKFRGINPDPFISYNLEYKTYLANNLDFHIGNRAMYFADYKFDNTFSINFKKQINDHLIVSFNNSYRFQEEYNNKYELVNTINLSQDLGQKRSLNYTISSYATKDDIINQDLEVDYYYAGGFYKEYFYKNWAYYNIDAGLIFRDENSFEAKGRLLFRIGALFGNAKPKFNN